MNFKYNPKINKRVWQNLITKKEAFGLKFPDQISITEQDGKIAKEKASEFSVLWNRNKEIRTGIFKIYKYKLPKTLECYIVTTKTSAIDFKKKYILLSMYTPADKVSLVIIHEFSHIALLAKWGDFCKKLRYTDNGIQELKEVLTVINNLEYKNIDDKGYVVHKNIREIVKNMWLENHNLEKIISNPKIMDLINLLKTIHKK